MPKQNRKKWDAKSRELIFVGYGHETKGYRFIHPETRKLMTSRHAVFFERQVIDTNNLNVSIPKVSNDEFLHLENDNETDFDPQSVNGVVIQDVEEPSGVVWCTNDENEVELESNVATSSENLVRRSERVPRPKVWPDFVT